MELIRTGDAGYDDARTIFNAMVDKRPAVIAACATADDVAAALDLARAENHDVAVRAGGHSVAGMSLNDGGLVVDVRPMQTIEIDADAGLARVGAGVLWGEFDRAAQEHGLATTGGRASTTGVAGFTLGGGSGWLERAHGLACDNLVSVDLVTADGRAVTASEDEHPELFWALHGGGGNFGVATSFVFRMHPVGPVVTAGLMLWAGDAARDVGRRFRDVAYDAPDALGSALAMLTGPPEPFVPEHLQRERTQCRRSASSVRRSISSARCPTQTSSACSTTRPVFGTTGRRTTTTSFPTTPSTCSSKQGSIVRPRSPSTS
jgi:FAD/FMN-containing dehydrogenase